MADVVEMYAVFREIIFGKDIFGIWFIIVLLIAGNILNIPIITRFHHPRYLLRFIVSLLLIGLSITFIFEGWFPKNILFNLIYSAIISAYLYITYKSSKIPMFFAGLKIKELNKIISSGVIEEKGDSFLKEPFYFIDFVEHYHFILIKAAYLKANFKYAEAYELYESINVKKLFDNEKEDLKLKKAFVLWLLGDLNRMKIILEDVHDTSAPIFLLLQSYLFESMGDLDKASTALYKALGESGDKNNEKPVILNQLGRIRLAEPNTLDAIYHYYKAVELAKKINDKNIIHVAYQNLIHTCILINDKESSNKYLKEYEALINKNNLNDLLEIINLKLELARQSSDKNAVERQIIEGYEQISRRVSGDKKLFLDICILRAMSNTPMELEEILNEINKNIEPYFSLNMPVKYRALKEIFLVFKILLENSSEKIILKYNGLFSQVLDYFKKESYKDIEYYITTLHEYEIYNRCEMEKEKVMILKEFYPYDFERIYSIMVNVKDIYQTNGHFIQSIACDLDIADEGLYARRWDIMDKHVKLAENNMQSLKNHPATREFYLRLAFYYFCLNNIEKARYYFELFVKTNVSICHYALWLQRFYKELNSYFKMNPEQSGTSKIN